jgi:hypothetical protein
MAKPVVQTEIDPALVKLARKHALQRGAIRLFVVLPGTVLSLYLCMRLATSAFRPETPAGGWVVDPAWLFIVFASGYGTAFVAPLVLHFGFNKRWERQDAALGFKIVPPKLIDWSRPIRATIQYTYMYVILFIVGVSVVVAALAAASGFVVISEQGIEDRMILRPASYAFDQVRELIVVPPGERLPHDDETGPLLRVGFTNGRHVDISGSNGVSQDEIDGVVRFLAAKTRLTPRMPRDLLP